jgi:hypothetical protein
MNPTNRPYVQLAIDAVDVVLSDPEGQYDADLYDRYETFDSARDAALTSVEVILDEGDYDDEEHRRDLETMRAMLEAAQSYEDLTRQPTYRRFLRRLKPIRSAA